MKASFLYFTGILWALSVLFVSSVCAQTIYGPKQQFVVIGVSTVMGTRIAVQAGEIKESVERCLRTNSMWDRPAQILIYNTRPVGYNRAGFFIGKEKGVVTRRISTYIQNDLVEEVLPVQITALVLSDIANRKNVTGRRDCLNCVPLWLIEGIQSRCSSKGRDVSRSRKALRRHRNQGTYFSLEEFLTMRQYPTAKEEVEVFKLQSYVFVKYLLSQPKGPQHIKDFLVRLASGESSQEGLLGCFRAVYGTDGELGPLRDGWFAHIEETNRLNIPRAQLSLQESKERLLSLVRISVEENGRTDQYFLSDIPYRDTNKVVALAKKTLYTRLIEFETCAKAIHPQLVRIWGMYQSCLDALKMKNDRLLMKRLRDADIATKRYFNIFPRQRDINRLEGIALYLDAIEQRN